MYPASDKNWYAMLVFGYRHVWFGCNDTEIQIKHNCVYWNIDTDRYKLLASESTDTFYLHVLTPRYRQKKQALSVCICMYWSIDTYRWYMHVFMLYPDTDKIYLVSICLRYWQDKTGGIVICVYLPSSTGRYAPGLLMLFPQMKISVFRFAGC